MVTSFIAGGRAIALILFVQLLITSARELRVPDYDSPESTHALGIPTLIHIPKTAGTSIIHLLNQTRRVSMSYWRDFNLYGNQSKTRSYLITVNDTMVCPPWHIPPRYFRVYENETFVVVRNPYDRMISEYFYRHRNLRNASCNHKHANEWLAGMLAKYEAKDRFLQSCHFLPQTEFVYGADGFRFPRWIFRFEDLVKSPVLFGMPLLYHLNGGHKHDCLLNQIVIEKIRTIYRDDFVGFGYNFSYAPTLSNDAENGSQDKGDYFTDLSTLKSLDGHSQVIVSMGNREVDIKAWLILSKSIRNMDFDGDIVLMWFGNEASSIISVYKVLIETLKVRIVLVKNPTNNVGVHKSVTGRVWDWTKLLTFTLTQYSIGIFMDVDMLMVNDFSNLWTCLSQDKSFAFTPGVKSLLNSGMFVFRPSMDDFKGLIQLTKNGVFSKRDGWNGAGLVQKMDNHWDECQGLLYYYFMQFQNRGVVLDMFVYNSPAMSSTAGGATIIHFAGEAKPCPISSMKSGTTEADFLKWPFTVWNAHFIVLFGFQAMLNSGCTPEPSNRDPVIVSNDEYSGLLCSFSNEVGMPTRCEQEIAEHRFVEKWVPSNASVLELGARYGTTSCAISRAIKNSGKQIAVEPDNKVWDILEWNRLVHNCIFTTHRGLVSSKNYTLAGDAYGKSAMESFSGEDIVPHKTFAELQTIHSIKFDTLLIDCEGCILDLFQNNNGSDILQDIKLILLEADQPKSLIKKGTSYEQQIVLLERMGFTLIDEYHEVERPNKLWHYALRRHA